MIWMALSCIFGAAFNHLIRNAQARDRNMAWVGAWNYVVAALASLAWWAISSKAPLGREAAFYGLLSGAFYGVGYLVMYACIRAAGVGVTATVNRLAVAVPIAAAVLVWREIPDQAQIGGIALALIAFPCLAYGRALPDDAQSRGEAFAPAGKRFGLLALAFGVQGIALLFMKGWSRCQLPDAEVPFMFFLFAAAAVATTGPALAAGRPRLPDFWHGLALGAANVLTTYWLMVPLDKLPTTEVFLTTSVGAILLNAATAAVLWKERYRGVALLGLVLAAIALVLVNLGKW